MLTVMMMARMQQEGGFYNCCRCGCVLEVLHVRLSDCDPCTTLIGK
jgi:hypothetical protein